MEMYGSNSRSQSSAKINHLRLPRVLMHWIALASSHFGDASDAARIAMPGVQSALNGHVVLQGGEAPPHLYSRSHTWLSCWTTRGTRRIESKQRGHEHWLLATMPHHISHLHVLNLSSQLRVERKSCKLHMWNEPPRRSSHSSDCQKVYLQLSHLH